MAVAPSWELVAAPELRPVAFLPGRGRSTRSVPVYPPGRHRGARRSWVGALFAVLTPRPRYAGRHRPGAVGTAYVGRHRS